MPRPSIVVFVLMSAAVPSLAQNVGVASQTSTTRLLPVSGVLTSADGQPLTGSQVVVFGLYDAEQDDAPLWTETQQVEADARGRYSAYLGAARAIPQQVFSTERARWLGVEVEGRQLRRMMLVAVPYALRAADAETLGGKPLSSFVLTGPDGRLRTSAGAVAEPLIDGSGTPGQLAKFITATTVGDSFVAETATGRVGIGTTDPTGGGVVDSKFSVRSLDNNTGIAVLNETNARRFALNTLSSGAWLAYDGGGGIWNPGLSQLSGKAGIGITSPESNFHVKSTGSPAIRIDGPVNIAGQGPKLRWTEATGTFGVGFEAFLESNINTLIFRAIDSNVVTSDNILTMKRGAPSNVGIGVQDPLDKLHVAGDIRVGTGTTGCVKDADATVLTGTCSSDRRLKKNITPFGRALDDVGRLQPVHFRWRTDEYPERHFGASETFGLIAQDVEQVLPELVTTDEQGYKAVRYNALPMLMLQAIKDLKAENDQLKELLRKQEERLQRLEARASK